jgi:hypothetical protein
MDFGSNGFDDERDLGDYFEMDSDQSAEYIGVAHVDLLNTNLHQQLLSTAITLASKDWWWKFRSQEYKLKKITMAYRHLNKLIEEAKEE